MPVKKKQDPNKLSKRLRTKVLRNGILFLVFLILFIFGVVNLFRWGVYTFKSSSLAKKLVKMGFSQSTILNNENVENEKLKENPIDFDELKEHNEDTVAWITIADTSINYPIVQAENNEYYLHKDFNEKYSTCGWIFMDFRNTPSMVDKNTVIFGHNIKAGIMFADLQKVHANELGEKVVINIYTPTERLDYRVYSSYIREPDNYAIKSNIVDNATQYTYIQTMLERSDTIYNVVPDKTDKLITLSTCDSTGNNRVLVHGVYVGGETYRKK